MSEREIVKTGVVHTFGFWVYDSNGAAVTGLVNGDFTKKLAKNNANSAITVTVTETDSSNLPGRYHGSYTPDTAAVFEAKVSHATHNPKGWIDEVRATALGIPTVQELLDALLDVADAIDGETVRNVLVWLQASGYGPGAGTEADPYMSPDGTEERLSTTFAANGARETVTKTPPS